MHPASWAVGNVSSAIKACLKISRVQITQLLLRLQEEEADRLSSLPDVHNPMQGLFSCMNKLDRTV